MASDWPGNVRELGNVLSRAILHAAGRTPSGEMVHVQARDLGGLAGDAPQPTLPTAPARVEPELPLREAVQALQRERIESAVQATQGNWAAAARRLGMNPANLHHLAKRLGLKS